MSIEHIIVLAACVAAFFLVVYLFILTDVQSTLMRDVIAFEDGEIDIIPHSYLRGLALWCAAHQPRMLTMLTDNILRHSYPTLYKEYHRD